VKRPRQRRQSLVELFSVLHDETPMARGFLLKQNSKGAWQSRYYQLRGSFLMYWASEKKSMKKGGGAANPASAIDLRLLASVEVFQFMKFASSASPLVIEEPALKLTSLSGNEIMLRACGAVDRKNIPQWQQRIAIKISDFGASEPASADAGVDEGEAGVCQDYYEEDGEEDNFEVAGGGGEELIEASSYIVNIGDPDEECEEDEEEDEKSGRESVFEPLPDNDKEPVLGSEELNEATTGLSL